MFHPEIDKIDHEVQTSLEYLSYKDKQQIEIQLDKLREEKFLLEGKIKGYLTLSDICREYKEELSALREEYNKLQDKVNMMAKVHSNDSPTPDDDIRIENRREIGHVNDSSPHHSFVSQSNNVASSILQDRDTPIKTGELYGGQDYHPATETAKPMSHSQDFQDKYPMQESLAPESATGLGFERIEKSPDNTFKHLEGIARSGDLMKFSMPAQRECDENQIEEILKSVHMEGNPVDIPEMKKVISVVKSYSDAENEKLKKGNNILMEETKNLKFENSSLKKRIQMLEHQLYELSNPSSRNDSQNESTQNNGWVHVQKVSQNQPVQKYTEPYQQTVPSNDEIFLLKQNNEQLKEANQRWSSEWNKLQQHYDNRISELQAERDKLTKEITDYKIAEDSKFKEYDKMLMNSKRRANDEENAKEEAFLQLTAANNRAEVLQNQLAQAQDSIVVLRREKHGLETEISILKQQPVGMAAGVPALTNDMRSPSELKTENDVLRQQLLVFQEDFDRERSDRAKAQSTKDEYKKQNEVLKKRARQVEQKNTSLERQVKNLEDNNRKLNDEKSANLQEISTLKIQLQREREKVATVNQNGYHPPLVQSAGLQQQQQRQQFIFGQPIQRPMQFTIAPTYDQMRVPQLNGVVNTENPGSPFSPTNPPNGYFQTNQAGKQTEFRTGAWTCGQCTYVNYPGRTVCEMCGYIQNASSDQISQSRQTGSDTLHPRGEHLQQQQQQTPQYQQQTFGQFVATNKGAYQQPP